MTFDYVPFSSISGDTWLSLLNNRELHRHMPLAGAQWTADKAVAWAASKDRQWDENGYGPWAILVDGTFAGWGGFQKEGADADFGLVLLPEFWGHGRTLHDDLMRRGFSELGLDGITILLPPSRTRLSALTRLGYVADGETSYEGHRFLKFRMARAVA